ETLFGCFIFVFSCFLLLRQFYRKIYLSQSKISATRFGQGLILSSLNISRSIIPFGAMAAALRLRSHAFLPDLIERKEYGRRLRMLGTVLIFGRRRFIPLPVNGIFITLLQYITGRHFMLSVPEFSSPTVLSDPISIKEWFIRGTIACDQKKIFGPSI